MWVLWQHLADWSQKAFGRDEERGPLGSLRHLQQQAADAVLDESDQQTQKERIADCVLFALDAARRSGMKSHDLLYLLFERLEANKAKWPEVEDDKNQW